MTLKEDTAEPGLWRSAAPGAPGVHAVIIGISEYPFLSGGSQSASVPNTFGMGQLTVSAKTAVRVFDWLRARSSLAGQPLASCRLLLAPAGPVETKFVQDAVGAHYASPSFRVMRDAIDNWSKEFLRVPQAQANGNVSFFFFSGHGLEHTASPSLLATDFLEPLGDTGVHNSVSFVPMRDALKTYNMAHSFYFLDACRNVPPGLQTNNPVGQSFLTLQTNPTVRPRPVMWLYGTGSGDYSFSPPDPAADGTFFGQALIEGLAGIPPEYRPYDVSSDPGRLTFEGLEDFAKDRTLELLRAVDPGREQAVESAGDPHEDKIVLATRSWGDIPGLKPSGPGPKVPPPPHTPSGLGPGDFEMIEGRSNRIAPSNIKTFDGSIKNFKIDWNSAHEGFGHEWITDQWQNSFQYDYSRAVPGAGEPRVMRIMATEHADYVSADVDLIIPSGKSPDCVWISIGGRDKSNWQKLGLLVPYDVNPYPLRLSLVFLRPNQPGEALRSMTAKVGPPDFLPQNEDLRTIWNGLWEAQKRETYSSFGRALTTIGDMQEAHRALFEKAVSPIAAAIGGATLLRGGLVEAMRNWPFNLAEYYKSIDGAVLWSEILFRKAERESGQGLDEAMKYFSRIADVGPPRLFPMLQVAAQRIARNRIVEVPTNERYEAAARIVEFAAARAQPDGVFPAYGPLQEAFKVADLFQPPPAESEAVTASTTQPRGSVAEPRLERQERFTGRTKPKAEEEAAPSKPRTMKASDSGEAGE
jgi:hypothetical protein